MLHLRNGFVSRAWRSAAAAVLVFAGSHSLYACNPSYANGISFDDTYVYAETNILDPNGDVQANVKLYDPNGSLYELDGSPQSGSETTNLQQAINGLGGTWTNEGITYDYGVEYDPAYAPAVVCTATIQPGDRPLSCTNPTTVNFQITTSPGAQCPITSQEAGYPSCSPYNDPGMTLGVTSCNGAVNGAGGFNGSMTWTGNTIGAGIYYFTKIHVNYGPTLSMGSRQTCQ